MKRLLIAAVAALLFVMVLSVAVTATAKPIQAAWTVAEEQGIDPSSYHLKRSKYSLGPMTCSCMIELRTNADIPPVPLEDGEADPADLKDSPKGVRVSVLRAHPFADWHLVELQHFDEREDTALPADTTEAPSK